MHLRAGLVGTAVLLCFANAATAAQIYLVQRICFLQGACEARMLPSPTIVIQGVIVGGDAARFRAVLKTAPVQYVILRSAGGDANEAMAIGRDVRRLLIETEAPRIDDSAATARPSCDENELSSPYAGTTCVCDSACFLIYAAGIRRNVAYVGLHRPFYAAERLKAAGLDAGMVVQKSANNSVAEYLREMGVAERFIDLTLRTSSREIYTSTRIEMDASLAGWDPRVEEWLIAKCDTVSDRVADDRLRDSVQRGDDIAAFGKASVDRELCLDAALAPERAKRRAEH
jgi:hypothetical protein